VDANGKPIKTPEHVFAPELYLVYLFSDKALLVYFGTAGYGNNGLSYQLLQVFTKDYQGWTFGHCGKVILAMLNYLVFCTSKMSMG
jgi:hypothetical protein